MNTNNNNNKKWMKHNGFPKKFVKTENKKSNADTDRWSHDMYEQLESEEFKKNNKNNKKNHKKNNYNNKNRNNYKENHKEFVRKNEDFQEKSEEYIEIQPKTNENLREILFEKKPKSKPSQEYYQPKKRQRKIEENTEFTEILREKTQININITTKNGNVALKFKEIPNKKELDSQVKKVFLENNIEKPELEAAIKINIVKNIMNKEKSFSKSLEKLYEEYINDYRNCFSNNFNVVD